MVAAFLGPCVLQLVKATGYTLHLEKPTALAPHAVTWRRSRNRLTVKSQESCTTRFALNGFHLAFPTKELKDLLVAPSLIDTLVSVEQHKLFNLHTNCLTAYTDKYTWNFKLLTHFVSSLPLTFRSPKIKRNSCSQHSYTVHRQPVYSPASHNIWKASFYYKPLSVTHLNWQKLTSTRNDCTISHCTARQVCRVNPWGFNTLPL